MIMRKILILLNILYLLNCTEYQKVVEKFSDGSPKVVYFYKDSEMEILIKKQVYFGNGNLNYEITFDSVLFNQKKISSRSSSITRPYSPIPVAPVASEEPNPILTGYKISYHPDGYKWQEGSVLDDQPIGIQKLYYPNGNLHKIFYPDSGGYFKEYYENGKLKSEGNHENSIIASYYESGNLKSKMVSTDSNCFYSEEGNIIGSVTQENDSLIITKFFNNNGSLFSISKQTFSHLTRRLSLEMINLINGRSITVNSMSDTSFEIQELDSSKQVVREFNNVSYDSMEQILLDIDERNVLNFN